MRCTSPRTVGFKSDGKTIAWSMHKINQEYATFQLPCGKCLECRLEYGRQWAVRCVQEAQMWEKNCFITLTYSDEHLKNPKLDYEDFKGFIKRLRNHIHQDLLNHLYPNQSQETQRELFKTVSKETKKNLLEERAISYFVTGEYGEDYKRPHWHALIFNWSPEDATYLRTNDMGDKLFSSTTLDTLWGFNDPYFKPNEIGQVSFKSSGYVARYAAKGLIHGVDDPNWAPISKKSVGRPIGSTFLKKYYRDIFDYGQLRLLDGTTCSIPRYYEKWLFKNHKEYWRDYVTRTKLQKIENATEKARQLQEETNKINEQRGISGSQISRLEVMKQITMSRMRRLFRQKFHYDRTKNEKN